jgi:hypothetical protein
MPFVFKKNANVPMKIEARIFPSTVLAFTQS